MLRAAIRTAKAVLAAEILRRTANGVKEAVAGALRRREERSS